MLVYWSFFNLTQRHVERCEEGNSFRPGDQLMGSNFVFSIRAWDYNLTFDLVVFRGIEHRLKLKVPRSGCYMGSDPRILLVSRLSIPNAPGVLLFHDKWEWAVEVALSAPRWDRTNFQRVGFLQSTANSMNWAPIQIPSACNSNCSMKAMDERPADLQWDCSSKSPLKSIILIGKIWLTCLPSSSWLFCGFQPLTLLEHGSTSATSGHKSVHIIGHVVK